ncbi:hypothetical protein UFOVP1565_12 [uncultured Caudovirales phage]|jgi:hypothetical protein|uniref:Uncharacterized protein n=1 Tax=uncultured Caudovirales phage TaxID=2100421 RepID=A0A6J5S5N1_9CAUD|nr:hypothetical protein UFOVP311_28 [uncultured Caudovirales phage]CAB4203805.1 hypothetical protein UFOVP1388_7 [uncultured Caudovirales phage]CAB5229739.1 hypothetical protein UFOVP1565_12 [uncultured Caudovirales phage]
MNNISFIVVSGLGGFLVVGVKTKYTKVKLFISNGLYVLSGLVVLNI